MEKIKIFVANQPGQLQEYFYDWMIDNHPVEIIARQYAVTSETSSGDYRDSLVPLYTYCITYK